MKMKRCHTTAIALTKARDKARLAHGHEPMKPIELVENKVARDPHAVAHQSANNRRQKHDLKHVAIVAENDALRNGHCLVDRQARSVHVAAPPALKKRP